MKLIRNVSIALAMSFLNSFAVGPPDIVIKRAIVVGGGTSATTFDNPTQSTIILGEYGASSITGFESAMQFEFQVAGVPVNVTDFKATVGNVSSNKNGSIIWNKTPFGAYHPVDQGFPDYLVYNLTGNVTPTGANKWVSGLNDNTGTLIPSLSKFQLVNHPVPTSLVSPGNYHTVWYEMTFTYVYGGTTYSRTLLPSETSVMIMVVENLPLFTDESGGPTQVTCELSYDLSNWVPSPVSVPFPRPTVVQNIIALVPSTTSVDGLPSNERRFYRFKQTTMP